VKIPEVVKVNNYQQFNYTYSKKNILNRLGQVKVRGGKAPYAGNALKVMPIVPSPATFYDRERP
jgi:hypothetical protein